MCSSNVHTKSIGFYLKAFLLVVILNSSALILKAQDFNSRFQSAWQLSNSGKFDEALTGFNALVKEYPGYPGLHVQLSWIYLIKGDMPQAIAFADIAYQLNQADMASAIIKAYVLLGANRKDEGIQYLNMAIWLDPDGANLANLEKDFTELIKYKVNPPVLKEAWALTQSSHLQRNKAFLTINKNLVQGDQQLTSKNYSAAKLSYDKALSGFSQAPAEYQFLKVAVANRIAETFYNAGQDFDFPFATNALDFAKLYPGKASANSTISSAFIVSEHYQRQSDFEKGLAICKSYASLLTSVATYGDVKANFLLSYLKNLNLSQQSNQYAWQSMIPLATTLRQVTNTSANAFYHASAENLLGNAYSHSLIPVDRKKSAFYFQNAIFIAKQNGLDNLVDDISPNLALSYWQNGDKVKAKQIWEEAGNKAKAAGKLGDAEVNFNNAGAAFYTTGDFSSAAPLFQKAVDITEQIRQSLKGREKILYLQKNVSAYQFLIASHAKAGNGKGVFEVQNRDRARLLSETLNRKVTPEAASLQGFQNLLKADEAALFYSQMEAGTFIINVVTKESVSPVYLEDFQRWVDIKKQYLDLIHKADAKAVGYKPANEVFEQDGIKYKVKNAAQLISHTDMNEIMELTRECLQDLTGAIPAEVTQKLLSAYYQSLIAPVLTKVGAKKKLLIFPDGILNFLPFEALIAPDNSFLIQKFDVRYCQSAEVFKTVNLRNYSTPRKSFLGMGGALYEDMSESASPLRSPDQLVNLQELADENVFNNKPQREIYAALFGSKKMNYLPGTLQEIKNLSTIFPDKDVFYGTDMTENRIKQMSTSGQLKNYKVLHLATHGFAVPEIPELSGIAMCIFNKVQGGEDGYLTAPEISNLKLNADLAVLSACETGLGKIYGGEGVSGLTASLLTAGANQALVSLWPVSDEGTMYFMTGLYTLTSKEGKSYDEAASIMKRKFITGEFGPQFRHFNFWAPYVNYGK